MQNKRKENKHMDYEQIKKLIQDMGNSKVDELQIEFPEGIKIGMKKNTPVVKEIVTTPTNTMPAVMVNTAVAGETIEMPEKPEEHYHIVKSPMVGTFYSKPSPKAEPYVKVGDKVKKGDVVCIVEAMKLMNEIESEFDGEVVEICVKDEEMVEYGRPLIKIQ